VGASQLSGQAVPLGRLCIHSKPPSKLKLKAAAKLAAADEEIQANHENGKRKATSGKTCAKGDVPHMHLTNLRKSRRC